MLSISFSSEEMREFLHKTDKYFFKVLKVSYSYSEYHNKVVDTEREIEILYPKDIPLENFLANKTYVQLLNWSLVSVFERELKIKLLNL
jgi:hypothetical protein